MIYEVMIVDDEAPARAELKAQIDRTGRAQVVSEAVCLQEAIAKIKRGGVDVVFMDCTIAGANTTLLVDALPEMKRVPQFVFLTAYSDFEQQPFGVEPVGWLVKPISSHKLHEMLDQVNPWNALDEEMKMFRKGAAVEREEAEAAHRNEVAERMQAADEDIEAAIALLEEEEGEL